MDEPVNEHLSDSSYLCPSSGMFLSSNSEASSLMETSLTENGYINENDSSSTRCCSPCSSCVALLNNTTASHEQPIASSSTLSFSDRESIISATNNKEFGSVMEKISEMRLKLAANDEKINELLNETKTLKSKISEIEKEREKQEARFIMNLIQKSDSKVQFYLGLPTYDSFWNLFRFVKDSFPQWFFLTRKGKQKRTLSAEEQCCLTLMRLRLALRVEDLADRFQISSATASRYIHLWVAAMYASLVPTLVFWPKGNEIRATLPISFRKHFRKCISIIDCFEIRLDRPIKLKKRASTFSTYKSSNTVKYLIGITPQGYISFISPGYGGRVSDKFIFQDSGFLEFLKPGDLVIADRGFLVHEDVALCGASMMIPAFKGKRRQLKRSETEESRMLAKVRIHVERVIGTLKKKFS